ncbi:MAG: nuclear transport factor 2 family protein [Nitrospinae bacterium]|nr:nuclear transport factor 2 family protein [Nitrospinota bacterium]
MIDEQWAKRFAADWIESWNSHDLDRILAHYADDFEMSSPFIVQMGFSASGTLKGREKIRPYWEMGLARAPQLKFVLLETLVGADSLTIYYRNNTGKLAAETLVFNERGKVVQGIAHYKPRGE